MDLSTRSEVFKADDQSWLGSAHGTDSARSITLDTSAFTAATHYPDGFFPSGTPLGEITATGLYGPWTDAAVDGTGVLAGFLLTPVRAPLDNAVDVQGALLDHGRVVTDNLPIAVTPSAVAADVAGRIIFV